MSFWASVEFGMREHWNQPPGYWIILQSWVIWELHIGPCLCHIAQECSSLYNWIYISPLYDAYMTTEIVQGHISQNVSLSVNDACMCLVCAYASMCISLDSVGSFGGGETWCHTIVAWGSLELRVWTVPASDFQQFQVWATCLASTYILKWILFLRD